MTNKLSKHAGGGELYTPAMMEFDGSTGYYSDTSVAYSGNKLTIFMQFNRASFTGNDFEALAAGFDGGGYQHPAVLLFSSDYATTDYRSLLKVQVQNSAGAVICALYSNISVTDNTNTFMWFAFDGDTGSAVFKINGDDADDTGITGRVAPTTGTLGSTGSMYVGSYGATSHLDGAIRYFGYSNSYLTNDSDFYTPDSGVKELDEAGWTEFGSQPLFFNPHGFMKDNRGTAGDMTANGGIDISDSGNTGHPILGINTIGDAVAADISIDKIAWVDGVEIVGTRPLYNPGMMTFDGATGYYSKTLTTSGNALTGVVRFNMAAFTGGGVRYAVRLMEPGGSNTILSVLCHASDHANAALQSKVSILVQNNAAAWILILRSTSVLVDGADHALSIAYDATAGTSVFYVDGVDEDDPAGSGRVETTGTLGVGASSTMYIGASQTPADYWNGEIGYFGFRTNAYLTNPTDFYHPTSGLQELDESGWTEWGAQPEFWNKYGSMELNKGSAGNMTVNGTITGPD